MGLGFCWQLCTTSVVLKGTRAKNTNASDVWCLASKGGFKSEDTGKSLRLQHKYSKSLSWAENLNKLFTVLCGKFKFSAQNSDLEYLCWRRKIFPVSSHLKPPLGYGIYLIDSITYWKYEIGLTSNSKEIGCPYICRWEKKSHLILQTERGKRCNRIALLKKHEGTCFLSLPTNKIAKKKPYNWKLITLVWPPCKFLTIVNGFW